MNSHARVFFPAISFLSLLTIFAAPLVLFPLRISFSSLTRLPSVWLSPSTATFTVGSAFATRKFKVKFVVLPFFAVNSLPSVYTFAGLPESLLPSSCMPSSMVEPVATLTETPPTASAFFT